jgi:hypothetical protein
MSAEPTQPPTPMPWLNARRLRVYPRVIFAGLAIGFALALLLGSGTRTWTGRLGGDFPAFYAAGRILAHGEAARLYDWQAQARAQTDLFPGKNGSEFLAFAYPPYVALLYVPLAALPYRVAYVLHTLAMVAALFAAAWLLAGVSPRVRRYAFEGFCMSVAFVPMFIALYGGQLTPLLVLALSAALLASARGHDLIAGICLGALWIKPQYAAPLIALFALARPRTAKPALIAAILAYAAGVWVHGWAWPVAYLHELPRFHQQDQRVNALHSIGLLGVSEALLGVGSGRAIALGCAAMAVCVFVLVRAFRAVRAFDLRIAAIVPLVILLQPHAMYYDAGLLVPSFAVVAGALGRAALWPLGAVFVSGMLAPFGEAFGVSPAFATLLAAAVVCVRGARRADQKSASAGT